MDLFLIWIRPSVRPCVSVYPIFWTADTANFYPFVGDKHVNQFKHVILLCSVHPFFCGPIRYFNLPSPRLVYDPTPNISRYLWSLGLCHNSHSMCKRKENHSAQLNKKFQLSTLCLYGVSKFFVKILCLVGNLIGNFWVT